jgi:F-type H+-transporting ATPase subunit b
MLNEKFWLAISFLIFASLIAKYVAPMLLKMMDDSAKKIADNIASAANLKKQAEELLEATKKHQKEAIEYCNKLIADAQSEAQKLIDQSQLALESEVSKRLTAAMERIKTQEEYVVRDLKNKIINDAVSKLEKDLAGNLNQEQNNQFTSKSISSL